MRKSIKGRNQIKQIIIYLKNTLPYNIPIYTPPKNNNVSSPIESPGGTFPLTKLITQS